MLSSSFKPNHHNKSICLIIDNIIKNMPELEDFKEPLNPTKIKLCMHNSLCYEAECGFAHTYTIEARKKIRQAYLKEMKKQKIEELPLLPSRTSSFTSSSQKPSSLPLLPSRTSSSSVPFYSTFKTSLNSVKKSFFPIIDEDNSIIRINKWKDKIIEILNSFVKAKLKCNTNEECIEIINIIYDIIKSFIMRPNTMIEIIPETTLTSKNIYNYRKYRIYNIYLKDKYKTRLNETDLQNTEFIKASEEFIEILEKTLIFKKENLE